MLSALNKLTLRLTENFSEAQIYLRRIPNDDPVSFVDYVKSKLDSGEYKLAEILFDGEAVGITVFCIDKPEFVSIATYAYKHIKDLRFILDKAFEKLAKENECNTLRMHTVRHGLIVDALNTGWHVSEVVLRRKI